VLILLIRTGCHETWREKQIWNSLIIRQTDGARGFWLCWFRVIFHYFQNY
jgi:hypothetical protein